MTASDKAARPIKVHSSSAAPPLSLGYPAEIQLWFPPQGKTAFVLCAGCWTEWKAGIAIKDVCPEASHGAIPP